MTDLLPRNDKFITFHNKCSKIPLSKSRYFAECIEADWDFQHFIVKCYKFVISVQQTYHLDIKLKLK